MTIVVDRAVLIVALRAVEQTLAHADDRIGRGEIERARGAIGSARVAMNEILHALEEEHASSDSSAPEPRKTYIARPYVAHDTAAESPREAIDSACGNKP